MPPLQGEDGCSALPVGNVGQAPLARPPVQPPCLAEKKAISEMCGLHGEISVGREGRDNSVPGARMWATAWGLCVPLPGVPLPWQASPGAGLDVCLELAAVF